MKRGYTEIRVKRGYSEIRVWLFIIPFFLWVSLFAYDKMYADLKGDLMLPTPEAKQVTIKNHTYSPQTITVAVNTTITWTNMDEMAHTVSSDSDVFESN